MEILNIIRAVLISILIFLIIAFCFSCNPCKRFARNHPECYQTITVTDTIYIQSVRKDTVLKLWQIERDTVIIEKGRLIQKIFKKDSLIYLSGECRADTIYKEVKVKVPTPIKSNWLKDNWLLIVVCVLFLILFFKK